MPGGARAVTGGTVDCQLGDPPVGGQAIATVYAVAPLAPGACDATATVASPWGDPKLDDNGDTVSVRVK